MKAVILAGGLGTRISEETDHIPKPMIQIGGKPILWHIMKHYSNYGVNEFIICCGYKGYVIKEYFSNYLLHDSDLTINIKDNKRLYHENRAEDWTVTLIDTGLKTMTGGRLKKIESYVKNEKSFCMTYGDGLSNVDIGKLIDFHSESGKLATLTAVSPPSRFGVLNIKKNKVESFDEKPQGVDNRINGGFFVLSPKILGLIKDDSTVWEKEPLEKLAKTGELSAFCHDGFWQPMDTLREKMLLQEIWDKGNAPWSNF
jgi:glucose-1-phosphate cytidylyltransferase